MPNAIACTQVSTHQQADQYGVKTQLEDITKYAQAHNLTITEHVDEAQSGADTLESREAIRGVWISSSLERVGIVNGQSGTPREMKL